MQHFEVQLLACLELQAELLQESGFGRQEFLLRAELAVNQPLEAAQDEASASFNVSSRAAGL